MDNNYLANKIKALRLQKGFSQEKLAEDTQLSLRTIQRVENGETEPRGYTLNRLASALGSTIDELTAAPQRTDKVPVLILNLSALSFLLFPLLGIIVPLTIWALVKQKTESINNTLKHLLNSQILWCLMIGGVYCLLFTNTPVPRPFKIGRPEAIMLCIAMLYAINFVLIIVRTLFGVNVRKRFINLY